MRWVEVAGFVAFGLNVVGNWLLTNKNSKGWGIRIGSNAAQLLYAGLIRSPSLFLNGATFAVINVIGWLKWRRMAGHADTCGVARRRVCNCGRLA